MVWQESLITAATEDYVWSPSDIVALTMFSQESCFSLATSMCVVQGEIHVLGTLWWCADLLVRTHSPSDCQICTYPRHSIEYQGPHQTELRCCRSSMRPFQFGDLDSVPFIVLATELPLWRFKERKWILAVHNKWNQLHSRAKMLTEDSSTHFSSRRKTFFFTNNLQQNRILLNLYHGDKLSSNGIRLFQQSVKSSIV